MLDRIPESGSRLPRRARPHLARLGNLIALVRTAHDCLSFFHDAASFEGRWLVLLFTCDVDAESSLEDMHVASDSKSHDSNQEKRPSMTEGLCDSLIENLMQNNIRWLDTLENQTTPRCAPSGTRCMS